MSTTNGLPVMAVEAVLLRPNPATAGNEQRQLWPLLVLVLDELHASSAGARELFDQLDRGGGPAFLGSGDYHWFVYEDQAALLGLAIHAPLLIGTDVEIMVPARSLMARSGLAATARTVALTSRRHARLLTPGLGVRAALDHVALVGQIPAELTGLLGRRRRGTGRLQLVR